MNRASIRLTQSLCTLGLLLTLGNPLFSAHAQGPEAGGDNEPPATVQYRIGMFYVVREEWDKAIAAFDKAVAQDPGFDEAIFARGDCYAALGAYDLALADYAEVMRLMPRYGRPYYQRALLYLETGQPDTALADLQIAVERMPVVPEPHLILGDLYFARGEQAQALAMYTRYVELAGPDAESYVLARVGVLVALKP